MDRRTFLRSAAGAAALAASKPASAAPSDRDANVTVVNEAVRPTYEPKVFDARAEAESFKKHHAELAQRYISPDGTLSFNNKVALAGKANKTPHHMLSKASQRAADAAPDGPQSFDVDADVYGAWQYLKNEAQYAHYDQRRPNLPPEQRAALNGINTYVAWLKEIPVDKIGEVNLVRSSSTSRWLISTPSNNMRIGNAADELYVSGRTEGLILDGLNAGEKDEASVHLSEAGMLNGVTGNGAKLYLNAQNTDYHMISNGQLIGGKITFSFSSDHKQNANVNSTSMYGSKDIYVPGLDSFGTDYAKRYRFDDCDFSLSNIYAHYFKTNTPQQVRDEDRNILFRNCVMMGADMSHNTGGAKFDRCVTIGMKRTIRIYPNDIVDDLILPDSNVRSIVQLAIMLDTQTLNDYEPFKTFRLAAEHLINNPQMQEKLKDNQAVDWQNLGELKTAVAKFDAKFGQLAAKVKREVQEDIVVANQVAQGQGRA